MKTIQEKIYSSFVVAHNNHGLCIKVKKTQYKVHFNITITMFGTTG